MKMKFILGFVILLGFASCTDDDNELSLHVEVNPSNVIGRDGDVIVVKNGEEIEFQISGEADMINFYSGEGGHKYEFRNRTVAEGTPKLNFSLAANRLKAAQDIQILASTDFIGKYDSQSIEQATWNDLTPQEMKDYRENSAAKAMPTIDMSHYGGGKAVFLAYRLIVKSDTRFVAPIISNFLLVNNQADGGISTVIDGVSNAGFNFVTLSENELWKAKGSGNSLWKLSGSTITVNTTPFDAANLGTDFSKDGLSHELWAITKTIYLDRASPDTGVTIKDIQKRVENYKYAYTTNGVYKVTFEALSTGKSGIEKMKTSEVLIKVVD